MFYVLESRLCRFRIVILMYPVSVITHVLYILDTYNMGVIRLLEEDQKVVPIFKQSTLKDDIIMFSVRGDIINRSLKMAQNSVFCMKLLMRRKLYEKHQVWVVT